MFLCLPCLLYLPRFKRQSIYCPAAPGPLLVETFIFDHRDHINLEGAVGPKIGVKLNGAILSKLKGKLFFPNPFFVCSIKQMMLVFINIIDKNLLFWLLVRCYFWLNCFTFFLLK